MPAQELKAPVTTPMVVNTSTLDDMVSPAMMPSASSNSIFSASVTAPAHRSHSVGARHLSARVPELATYQPTKRFEELDEYAGALMSELRAMRLTSTRDYD